MNLFTQGHLQFLTGNHKPPCISVFVPMVVKGQETQQNPIRYKNLLDEAEELLAKGGMEKTEITTILKQARQLIHDDEFWQHQQPGLAVFFNRDLLQTFNLPQVVDEVVVVNDRFYIKPLMQLLYAEEEFYILALQKDRVSFFRATEHTIEQVEVPRMPRTVNETNPSTEAEEQTRFMPPSGRPGGSGQGLGQMGMVQGHGQGPEEYDRYTMRFFREIDKALNNYLRDSKGPMVLACVAELAPHYREVNTYQHLADEIIPGSPEGVPAEKLRDKAWKRIRPLYEGIQRENFERYKMLAGCKDGRAIKDIKEVVKAAPYGRVEVLFVDKNAKQWGVFDEENIKVKLEKEQRPGAQDLLDYAAVQTLVNGGTVFAVEPEDLPAYGSPVAAILRY